MNILILILLFIISLISLIMACMAYIKITSLIPTPSKFSPTPRNNAINYIKQKSTIVKVVYIDTNTVGGVSAKDLQMAILSANKYYNVIILSFYVDAGPADSLQVWQQLSDSDKDTILTQLHNNNSVLLLSLGGELGIDIGSCSNPYPNLNIATIAQFAIDNKLDGVDFDLEGVGNKSCNNGYNDFAVNGSKTVKNLFNNYGLDSIVTHAPQPPYFSPKTDPWEFDYIQIVQRSGDAIDWINIQYYNNNMPYGGNPFWPSITQPMSANIADLLQKGIPSEKIVIGKCGSISACNTNGDPQCYGCCKPSDAQYVGGQTLLDNIKSSGKCKGIMFWSLACPKGTVSSGTGLTFPTDSYPGDRPKCPNNPSIFQGECPCNTQETSPCKTKCVASSAGKAMQVTDLQCQGGDGNNKPCTAGTPPAWWPCGQANLCQCAD